MDKVHIIIVDTVNSKKFNSKHIRTILKEILISDSDFLSNEETYLSKNIEFFDLDVHCDKTAIEKALFKQHLFINIVSLSQSCECAAMRDNFHNNTTDCTKMVNENNQYLRNSFMNRYYSILKHAFIPKNKNALFLSIDDNDRLSNNDNETVDCENCDSDCEIKFMQLSCDVCRDQLIFVRPGFSFERKIQIWLLSKLISFDNGNFSFYCLPIISKLISIYSGIVPISIERCSHQSPTSLAYSYFVTNQLKNSLGALTGMKSSPTVPILIHAGRFVDWAVVKDCVVDRFEGESVFIGYYKSRLNTICQDVRFLLVSLLKYFKVFPQDNQLPFSTTQMASLVSDCLRSNSTVQQGKSLILFIEDIDWIASSCLNNEACSWLPEKCAPNIQVILTASKDSIQEKSLKCRLKPPIFIDVSLPDRAMTFENDICQCQQMWCLCRLASLPDRLIKLINNSETDDIKNYIVKILSMFMCSMVCGLAHSQITWFLSFDTSKEHNGDTSSDFSEKDQSELSEKAMMISSKERKVFLSPSDHKNISLVIHRLIDFGIIQQVNLNNSDECCYSLTVPQLSQYISHVLQDLIYSKDIDMVKCRLGTYYVYQTTNLHSQTLFVPNLLQYLSGLKDTVLKDWLLNWPVLVRLKDEFCVPVKLLSLWRSLLGPNTDYKPMINAYISSCLPEKKEPGDCCSCKSSTNIELQYGKVSLEILRQSTSDFSKSHSKHRCQILLDLARLSMQVGQYAVAKEIARFLLKQLDQLSVDRSFCPPFFSKRNLLASCLHLLFCTLDERLKTFEFVTEQTTPIFRRTVHYGARALLLQNDIVNNLKQVIKNNDNNGTGDVRRIDSVKIQQQLCYAEIRLAHIMTHFVFSLDGVEQSVINQHFMPSEIRSVTHTCMTQAHEIAIRLKDRQLLLEIQMTFGVIQPRENFKEKILLYKTPLRQALCIYGEGHIFVSRLYINIGISYEEQKKYIKAFEYFTLWSHVTHELLGRNHCKSLRSCGVFKEPIFKATAEFLKNLNDEEPNECLEEELSDCINNIETDRFDLESQDISVTGVGIGGSNQENLSIENMFMMRNSLEHESDWEIHSSDDETPNYTTAFELVIEKFKKISSNITPKQLLQSILDNSIIDNDDLSKEDIECLLKSQELLNDIDSSTRLGSFNSDGSVNEAFRITRMFRDLRDLAQWIPTTNLSPSDISLSRRLLELQRELEEFFDN